MWLPDKVQTTIPYLEKYDLVVSDCKIVDKNLQIIEDSFFKIMHSGEGFWKNFVKNTYLGCCMAFKKEILNYVLPFPSNIAMHDIWIGLITEFFGNIFFLHEPLVLYRRHGENASFSSEKVKFSTSYKILCRYYLIKDIIKRSFQYKTDMMITIITATYNSASTIRNTLESVNAQTYPHIEHIIVDGNSKDNTREIAKIRQNRCFNLSPNPIMGFMMHRTKGQERYRRRNRNIKLDDFHLE